MLILSRKPGESIVIDGRVIVRIMRVEREVVKVGIEAPLEISVHRQEVYEEIRRSNAEAATDRKEKPPRLSAPKNNPPPSDEGGATSPPVKPPPHD
jgi:carbon storage regulator